MINYEAVHVIQRLLIHPLGIYKSSDSILMRLAIIAGAYSDSTHQPTSALIDLPL
jgi:hypothetical protein